MGFMVRGVSSYGVYFDTSGKGKLNKRHHSFRAEVRIDGVRIRRRFASYEAAAEWIHDMVEGGPADHEKMINCRGCGKEIVYRGGGHRFCEDCALVRRVVGIPKKKKPTPEDVYANEKAMYQCQVAAYDARQKMMERLKARDAEYEAKFGGLGRIEKEFVPSEIEMNESEEAYD